MNTNFEKEFQESMNRLHFSANDKERLYQTLVCAGLMCKESEDHIMMKKQNLTKVAAIAAVCFLATGATAFAASRIVSYESSSSGDYEYASVEEINPASSGADLPEFPETLCGRFAFDGGNTVNVSGKDDSGNPVGNWDDLLAVYQADDGTSVNLTLSAELSEDDTRTPTDARVIDGIRVSYNYDEYLCLPSENEELSNDIQSRMETDDHFFVSYGSTTPETYFFSNVSFVKDDVSYHLYTKDGISSDELFTMAEELIRR